MKEVQLKGFDERDYELFLHPYQTASSIVMAHLAGLRRDLELNHGHKPIHNIAWRYKTVASIQEKLVRRGFPVSWESAQENLTDIAGIRILCYYEKDIYVLARLLKRQLDSIIIKECDYIKEPKGNGYRCYHLVLGIAVYGAESKQYYPVEIQMRTLAMDFWASMEHQLCYKANHVDKEEIGQLFKNYAEVLTEMESRLEQFYDLDLEKIFEKS